MRRCLCALISNWRQPRGFVLLLFLLPLLAVLSSFDSYVRDHTLWRGSVPVVFLCSTHLHILAELQFISALSSFIFPAAGTEVTEAAQKLVLIQHLYPDLLQVCNAHSSDNPTPKYGA